MLAAATCAEDDAYDHAVPVDQDHDERILGLYTSARARLCNMAVSQLP